MPKEIEIKSGEIFNHWKVIDKYKTINGKIYLLCLCLGCNKIIKSVSKVDLRSGKTKTASR